MTDAIAGFFAPWLIYGLILILHLLLPARTIAGYVRDARTAAPLSYRLNGLPVVATTALLWALAVRSGLLCPEWLYHHRWSGLEIGRASCRERVFGFV
jgi:hypothetical protein